ncbi:MAG: hypothetical protein HKN42_12395 [Granulosicoccus sp.]|nr:hypothetical protein [Granulosicoccus sp.]
MNQQSDTGREDPGDKVRQEAAKAKESVQEELSALGESTRDTAHATARDQFQKGKEVVDENVEVLSSAIEDAADRLTRDEHPLASYADELSSQLGRLSTTIQNSSLDDVASRAHRLARDNPGLFMLGSIALGIAAARFAKASDDREYQSSGYSDPSVHGKPQAAGVHTYQQSSSHESTGRDSATASGTAVGKSSPASGVNPTSAQRRGEPA